MDGDHHRLGACRIRGRCHCHLNGRCGRTSESGITIASVIMTGHPERLWTYIPAQIAGAMLGATLVWLFYEPHWGATQNAQAKLMCFSTVPAIRKYSFNFLSEVIGTFVL